MMRSMRARDALEVPGNIMVFESISFDDAKREINKIFDRHEAHGVTKLGEIPEGHDKERLRALFSAMGIKVGF